MGSVVERHILISPQSMRSLKFELDNITSSLLSDVKERALKFRDSRKLEGECNLIVTTDMRKQDAEISNLNWEPRGRKH